MDTFQHPSGRSYRTLPLPPDAALPAVVPGTAAGLRFLVLYYVNISAARLGEGLAVYVLPEQEAHLVVRLVLDPVDGARRTLFQRKIATGLEYDCGPVFLTFPAPPVAPDNLRIARRNLNGTGLHGTSLIGGIAAR